MYSVFRSPTLTDRRNIQQENNVVAKKPGALSARKPLADRKVNLKQENTPQPKAKAIVKPTVTEELYSDIDVCSYKEIKDTYNDILLESDHLCQKGMKNIFQCLLNNPSPKNTDFDFLKPEVINDVRRQIDYDANEISSLLSSDFNMDVVPFPVIDFDI